MEWDYIIIGAGSAGCVVANRLSENPDNRVLLLEAGGVDKGLRFRVPALAPLTALGDRSVDWCFATEPDPTRCGRVEVWPRGKVLGGSSSLNGTVYVRGNRGDYDHWRQLGLPGWGYDDLLPYFRKMEDGQIGLPDLYGRSGEIGISETRGPHSLASIFVEAMAELGVPPNPSYNGEEQTGAAITHTTQRAGWRCSSARGYLDPIRHRKNLRIQTDTTVRRILFTKDRAVGVEVDAGGARHTLSASREIILSAGAINSPKILMLSGIGDQEELGRWGIPVVRHCPEVGRNLQEHARINVAGEVNVPTLNTQLGLWSRIKYAFEYLLWRRGTLSHVLPAIAFLKSKPNLRYPDLQFHFGAFGFTEGKTLIPNAKPTMTIQPNVSRSESRGFIALRSVDPNDPPLIQPNLLASRRDMQTLIAGARIARRALRAQAFAPYFQRESAPGDDVQSDEEWETYIRETATILFHPCGTCRMGSDDGAVVDSDLRVRGAVGLRVIDASIIPQVPSGNINAISMTIGEKGADAIRKAAS